MVQLLTGGLSLRCFDNQVTISQGTDSSATLLLLTKSKHSECNRLVLRIIRMLGSRALCILIWQSLLAVMVLGDFLKFAARQRPSSKLQALGTRSYAPYIL
ncbi:hypothetical protein MJO29_004094 [Puccinia striiformis f. sp. tritici]|nr:hypothetical protein MJO29_004094 [Puccinia striiformis f. sp. tritici]